HDDMNSPDLSDDTLLDVDLSLLLSSEDEAKFHHVVYFLQLHPTLINQLSRQQVNAFRAAGLLEIELSASHRSASITREMLTTGPMALMFPHYKTFFGVNHVTFRWQATTSGVDVTMANNSRRPVFVGLRVLAPQGIMALHLHDLVRLLETPSKVLLLGYVVTKRAISLSVHPPAHNLLVHHVSMETLSLNSIGFQGLLYSQPILQYTRLGLTLNSELLVNEAGQSVPFVSQSVGWEVECASWKVLEDLVSDGCQMLHLSCATTSTALILEDGRGGAFPVGVDALKRLFQGSTVQLVQLSECPSPTGGLGFTAATQYATDRGAFDGGIRLLHVKDMVQRKVLLDFVPAILKDMPNMTVVATTLETVELPPPLKQFHVGLDSNPGGPLRFRALSTDAVWEQQTRLPQNDLDVESPRPTHAVAAAAPANNCSLM
ncbi:hypothetical protein DYB37_011807, partial [Aphanomyces astaci]